jgi:hypothetical protein
MNFLVIDTSNRDLSTFVASATQVGEEDSQNLKLVLRHALDGPSLERLSSGGLATTTMPILLVGGGYKAQSSEGFVRVNADGPSRDMWVVGAAGCLGAKSLRPLGHAQRAVLLPPSYIQKGVCRGGNANRQVKEAVEAAASLFGKATQATTIVEGQSNRANTFIFKAVQGWAWPEFPAEHQDRFSEADLFEAALKDRLWYLTRPSEDDAQEEPGKREALTLGICIVHDAWLAAMSSGDMETRQRLTEERPRLTLRGAPHGAINLRQMLADKRAELEEMGWKAEIRNYGDLFVVNAEKAIKFNVGCIYEDAVKAHLGVETSSRAAEAA